MFIYTVEDILFAIVFFSTVAFWLCVWLATEYSRWKQRRKKAKGESK